MNYDIAYIDLKNAVACKGLAADAFKLFEFTKIITCHADKPLYVFIQSM